VIRAGPGAGLRAADGPGWRAGGPGRVRSSAWPAAAGAVRSPATGRGRGRPGGRTVPGRASGHRRDRQSPPLRSITSMERCPPLHPQDHGRRRAWNGSWNGAAAIPAPPVLSVRFPVSSLLLVRPLSDAVVMVRRRSTVRFRNGAPAQRINSNTSNGPWGPFRGPSSSHIRPRGASVCLRCPVVLSHPI
jgi:hypothetical protein